MDVEKMREQFEQAIVKMHMDSGMPEDDAKSFLETGSNGYTSIFTKAAWWAWQASREAVVVEMPSRASEAYREYFDDFDGGSFNEAAYIRDVRKAIEAHGLKVAL